MHTVSTIIPIFSIVIIGWVARQRGFIPNEFLAPANRLVFYLAIPAVIFRSVAKSSFKAQFNLTVLIITISSVVAVFALAWAAGKAGKTPRKTLGTYMQTSIHGNLGYIGLAVAYYFMGQEGFVKAGIIGGFVMILQNFLAVSALVLYGKEVPIKKNRLYFVKKIFGNPVVLAAMGGILFSVTEIPVPVVIGRILDILGDLALPMALLVIGASLSFEVIRLSAFSIITTNFFKLMILPCVGFLFYRIYGIQPAEYLPALILLASPTATITYIMSKEMEGDPDFAVAAISSSTLISAVTFSFWLNVAR
jgi:hypothetical protein